MDTMYTVKNATL